MRICWMRRRQDRHLPARSNKHNIGKRVAVQIREP